MIRLTTYLLMALLLIALGFADKERFGNAGIDWVSLLPIESAFAADQLELQTVSVGADPPVENIINPAPLGTLLSEARDDDRTATPPVTTTSPSTEDMNPSPAAAASADSNLVDTSVVGHPIPRAVSIKEKCGKLAEEVGGDSHTVCGRIAKFVKKMVQEPRDLVWAPELEAELREYVRAAAPPETNIRYVECRQSVCVLEVASPHGEFRAVPPSPAYSRLVHEKRLYPDSGVTSTETDAIGTVITVTFRPFLRIGWTRGA